MRKNHSKIVCIKLVHLPYSPWYFVLKKIHMCVSTYQRPDHTPDARLKFWYNCITLHVH